MDKKRTDYERNARDLVSALALHANMTWPSLLAMMEEIYGKPIELRPVADRNWKQVTGLLLDAGDRVLIYYRAEHTILYQVHNIFHEFGHILLRDQGCKLSESVTADDVFTLGIREGFQRAYANGLEFDKPELVTNEQTAEAIAYEIARHLRTRPPTVQTEVFG
ncbi:MAG: hypothetical protein M3N46_05235 [Actinomycetota bacterium]|nr:hypothetical protein [Actinomycetota bacterium]